MSGNVGPLEDCSRLGKLAIDKNWSKNLDDSSERTVRALRVRTLREAFSKRSQSFKVGSRAQRKMEDYQRWESLEAAARAHVIAECTALHALFLHRRLYCGREAARVARETAGEKGSFVKSTTTAQVEGTGRVFRSRERRSLCFRATIGLQAVMGLLLLYHNMVGSGRGCLYDLLGVSRPNPLWNPFGLFPARKCSPNLSTSRFSTPLRHVSIHFRQQHSHQVKSFPFDTSEPLLPVFVSPFSEVAVLT